MILIVFGNQAKVASEEKLQDLHPRSRVPGALPIQVKVHLWNDKGAFRSKAVLEASGKTRCAFSNMWF